MQIDITLQESELGRERLAALRRESLRRRVPIEHLIKGEMLKIADALLKKHPQLKGAAA